MPFNWRFPIRFKILITLLLVVTTAVSLITYSMARLFHADKAAYIADLTSNISVHTAAEAHAVLTGHREGLQVFARVMLDRRLAQQDKLELLKALFEDFDDFVAVTLYEDGRERATVFDARSLKNAELDKQALLDFRRARPLPFKKILAGAEHVENTTLSARLPTLTLALRPTGADAQTVVAAVIRLDSLQRIAARTKGYDVFLFGAGGGLLAHRDGARVAARQLVDWLPNIADLGDARRAGTALEYDYLGTPMIGGVARVEFAGLMAGVQIPRRAAFLTARALLTDLIGIALVLLLVSAVIGLWWSRRITRPIEQLSAASQVVGQGRFDVRLPLNARDEIGDLAGSFNQMATHLQDREAALQQAQAALIHSEKMSAFGQLSAGIAHEVKNPLAGILGYAQLSLRKLDPSSPLRRNLEVIERETTRCKDIIDNLMTFARQESVSKRPVAINRVVEDAVAIVDHQLTIHRVKLDVTLAADLPPVLGAANALQQVIMNLMINAQQALNGLPGTVRVSTAQPRPGWVEIRVSDTGPGIAEPIQAKVFEPFYTTKPAGQGTGLGLSVSYGIVRDHDGDIRVDSRPGAGATFIIELPAQVDTGPATGTDVSVKTRPV